MPCFTPNDYKTKHVIPKHGAEAGSLRTLLNKQLIFCISDCEAICSAAAVDAAGYVSHWG